MSLVESPCGESWSVHCNYSLRSLLASLSLVCASVGIKNCFWLSVFFLSSIAASGDTVIVQLLCGHKCHVNLKDSVCISLMLSELLRKWLSLHVFAAFQNCLWSTSNIFIVKHNSSKTLFSAGLNQCSATLIKIPTAHLRSLLLGDCLSEVVFSALLYSCRFVFLLQCVFFYSSESLSALLLNGFCLGNDKSTD